MSEGSRLLRSAGFAVLAASIAACGPEAEPDALASWQVGSEPIISIGEEAGDSVDLFQRIADVAFGSDGGVVVADAGLSVVRVFDADGAFVRQIGRRGSGPGEFQYVRNVWVVEPDTLGVWDLGAQRASYFDRSGAFVRSVTLDATGAPTPGANPDFVVGTVDGSLVVASMAFGAEAAAPDRVSIGRFDTTGAYAEALGEGTGLVRAELGGGSTGPIPFSPYPHFAMSSGTVYRIDGYRPVVEVWAPTGRDSISFPSRDIDPSAAWDEVADVVRDRGPDMFREILPSMSPPDSIPALAGLLVDDTGHVWVKRYEPAVDALWVNPAARGYGGSWFVADPSGDLVATVEMPAGFAPLRIRGGRVLGLTMDELGIERVEVRTLSR